MRASVGVAVQNGVVIFTGAITEQLRGGLKVIAENTRGCVAVHDHMAWIEFNSGTFMPSPEDEEIFLTRRGGPKKPLSGDAALQAPTARQVSPGLGPTS